MNPHIDQTTAQQLTMDLGKPPEKTTYMLWYEKQDLPPEQAIQNACMYYEEKYGPAGKVTLPCHWKKNTENHIELSQLRKKIGWMVETSPELQPKHVAVYPRFEEEA
jgi:hypothetical protein